MILGKIVTCLGKIDMQETFAVRKFALLFIVTILLTLCACGKNVNGR